MPALLIFLLWVGAIIYFARQQEEETDHILRNFADREAWLRGYDKGQRDLPPTVAAPIVHIDERFGIEELFAEEFVPLQYYDRRTVNFEHPRPAGMAKDIAKEIVKRGAYLMECNADYPNQRVVFRMRVLFVQDEAAIKNYRR